MTAAVILGTFLASVFLYKDAEGPAGRGLEAFRQRLAH